MEGLGRNPASSMRSSDLKLSFHNLDKLHMVTPCHFAPHFPFANSLFLDKVYYAVRAGLELERGSPAPAPWMLRLLVGTTILDPDHLWRKESIFLVYPMCRCFHRDGAMTTSSGWLSADYLGWSYEYVTLRPGSGELLCPLGYSDSIMCWTNGVVKDLPAANMHCGMSGAWDEDSGGSTASDAKRAFLPLEWLGFHCREDKRRMMEESFLGYCASWINSCCFW